MLSRKCFDTSCTVKTFNKNIGVTREWSFGGFVQNILERCNCISDSIAQRKFLHYF